MLSELYIQNLAVIEKTSISFFKGLHVFTGETGAGKSIVIDAINAVLGQRTSKEIVRHGEQKAVITASFKEISDRIRTKLADYGYEPDGDEVLITREIYADSKSTARLMGRPVTVSILRDIGAELVTIHGQHDNQVLLSSDKHIDILDRYGDFSELQADYLTCYKNVVRIKREMKQTAMNEQEKATRIDLLSYQIQEINEASLSDQEDVQLEARCIELRNAAKIVEQLSQAYQAIFGRDGEGGGLEQVQVAASALERANEYYEGTEGMAAELFDLADGLSGFSERLSSLMESFSRDASQLDSLEERHALIVQLKRKYGETVSEILQFGERAEAELSDLKLSEKRLLELNEEGQREYARLLELGTKLSEARKKAAERFISSVSSELEFLDMPFVKLEVLMQPVKPNSRGQETVEFMISTNKGEPPKPIAKIASGGELSRIMLAIKNTLADKDEVFTLIFDEVDTGVSGRAAQKIGLKLHEVAENRQILSVTHLAQIAALADHQYLIKKQVDGERTFTAVHELDMDERVEEVARIMSTDEITDLMRQNAKEMLLLGGAHPSPSHLPLS